MIEERLHCFVVFTAGKRDVRSQVRQETLRLLARCPSDTLIELRCVSLQVLHVLIGLLKALLSLLVVLL